MSCSAHVSSDAMTLQALSSFLNPVWLTRPMPCIGLTHVDAVMQVSGVQGNAQAQFIIQYFAADLDTPDAPVALGSPSAVTVKVSADVTSAAALKAFYRLGIAANLSSGITPATLVASVDIHAKQCGGVLAKAGFDIAAPSAQISFRPVSGLLSARDTATLAAVIRVDGKNGGNLGTRLAVRTFTNDRNSPSAWTLLEAGWNTVTTMNAVRFTGALTPALSPSTNQWFQLGLAAQPATADVSATVSVLVMGAP
jgi:hypothetical protein